MLPLCACGEGFTEDLFEVRHREQLLDPGQEVRNEGLEGRVKTLVEDFLKQNTMSISKLNTKSFITIRFRFDSILGPVVNRR